MLLAILTGAADALQFTQGYAARHACLHSAEQAESKQMAPSMPDNPPDCGRLAPEDTSASNALFAVHANDADRQSEEP